MIQVAVMGYGTIGSGVVEVLETNKDKITEKTGKEIAVKYICVNFRVIRTKRRLFMILRSLKKTKK
jgi:homoserine dehydrogenase